MNDPLIQNEAETVYPPLKPPLTLAAELSASPTCTERKPPFEVGDSSAANPKCTRAMSTSCIDSALTVLIFVHNLICTYIKGQIEHTTAKNNNK
jgi:hypothetical protein